MANVFSEAQYLEVPKNRFNPSFEHKTSFQFGRLYPVFVKETLPGDKWSIQTSKALRFMPMISPVMHRIKVYEHWFFVPRRLCWKNWEKFISDSESGHAVPTVPWVDAAKVPATAQVHQTIGAYMGLPCVGSFSGDFLVDAMPLAGYGLIYNEYYRDQQTMPELTIELVDGLNTLNTDIDIWYSYQPLQKCWKKDYFTSALPAAQKGTPVLMPITTMDNLPIEWLQNASQGYWRFSTGGQGPYNQATAGLQVINGGGTQTAGGAYDLEYDPNGTLVAKINDNAVTLNTFRTAMALQAFLEKDNVGGGRYTEILRSHFSAYPPDYRLQRPEYLGGNVQNVIISEVLSTTETINDTGETGYDLVTPLGQMAGHGISVAQAPDNIEYYCSEHGIIYCLLSIEPDLTYYNQGLHRMWTRQTREEHAWPTFAHLGEQEIKNLELTGTHNSLQSTFGYTPRYSEYKYNQNLITGEFVDTLQFWHLGVQVPDNVALNDEFLRVDDKLYNLARIFAVSNDVNGIWKDYIIGQIYFEIDLLRALPRFAVPKLVG